MSQISSEPESQRTFSEVLEALGVSDNPILTLDEVVEAFGDRGIGALILVLSLMALIPWPPGGKALFAAPIILLALELAAQRNEVWLPRWILRASFPRSTYHKLITTPFAAPAWARRWILTRRFRFGFSSRSRVYIFAPWVRRLSRRRPNGVNVIKLLRGIESLARPRLSILTGPTSEILMGLTCVFLAVVMALPVPFGDMLPGLTIAFFALGVMQKDGAAVLVGAAGTVLTTGYLILIWTTVARIIGHIGAWLTGLVS